MKMLCCHDETGRINNIIFEPIPAGFDEHYDKLGLLYAHFDNPDALNGPSVANLYHVVAGSVVMRPDCPTIVSVIDRVVTLDNVPDNSVITVILNKGTSYEHHEIITDHVLEFDEPGKLEICIASSWPMLEGKYHVEIQ